MPRIRIMLFAAAFALAGCASHKAPIAVAAPPLPVVMAPVMPAGGRPGMTIPAMLADGSYSTPNRALSGAAATWHFRAALNVAALACRGPDDAVFIQRYNALLANQRGVLKSAETTLAAEYRSRGGANWRNGYDMAMTRLYNYWSQDFARPAFCASATSILAEAVTVDAAAFPEFAATRLPTLDRAFTDFYRAYDAWRGVSAPTPAIMPPMTAAPMTVASVTSRATPVAYTHPAPRIDLDPGTLDIR